MKGVFHLDKHGDVRLVEDDVTGQCIDYLRVHGWRVHRLEADVWRSKKGIHREEPGTPDFLAVWIDPGYDAQGRRRRIILYLEFKRPGGKLRKIQSIWIEDARRRGWPVAVVSSLGELRTFLSILGYPGGD